jgi:hypothetical protein
MFERYTERARRVIFFARYEASQFGSVTIETEHLLLGLIREDKNLTDRFLRKSGSIESIRWEIEGRMTIRAKVSTSIDLPLTNECKRILAYAAEEAERLDHRHIGTEHILLGILREEKCGAAGVLQNRGLQLDTMRESLVRNPIPTFVKASTLPEAGAVPDAETAIRIAEAVWLPVYGAEKVERGKPFKAELKTAAEPGEWAVWTVSGSQEGGENESSLCAVIRKWDGQILAITTTSHNDPSKPPE